MRARFWFLALPALLFSVLAPAAYARDYSEKEEEKLGKEGVTVLEKEYKVVNDAEQLKRIETIVTAIGPCTERPTVTYKVKILDTEDVNALSLPGGFIYVTKGLLEAAGSDDELAGVLAHEIAHNAHRHALKGLEKSAKMDQKMMLATILAVLASKGKADPSSMMLLGQVLKRNALSGYEQAAELESDHSAVAYLIQSKRYNPVGVLQFMQTLEREENRRPYVELGIYRTHPKTKQRVDAIRKQLAENNVPIVRLPSKHVPAAVARAATVKEKEIAEVAMGDKILYQPASLSAGQTPMQRAEETARAVSGLFREYVEERHVRVRPDGDTRIVSYRETPLLVVTPADAQFHGATVDELAGRAAKVLRAVIWDDFVRHSY